MGIRRLGGVAAALVAMSAVPAEPGAAAGSPPSATAAPATAAASTARVGAAPADQPLELVLPLKADLAGLQRAALAASTPGSPQYGRYSTIAALAARFGASTSTRRRVTAYLRDVGARDVTIDPTGLFADATMTAALAERLFATPLAEFRSNGQGFIAPDGAGAEAATAAAAHSTARVPAALDGQVTGVVGLDGQPLAGPARSSRFQRAAPAASQPSSSATRSGTPAGCPQGIGSGGFTPNQYLSAYGYDPLRSAGAIGQGERVALIEVDGYKYSDLVTFAKCFGIPIPALNTFGVGISRLLAPGSEATLDLEVLDAAAPGLSSINVFETTATAADTLRAMTAPLSTRQKPQVISASLGLCEPLLLRFVGTGGIESTEGALEMAAASGITFVASSGDQGSADCTSSNGLPARLLAVNYPASSWWVTGVGGTNLLLNSSNQILDQVVWNDAAVQPGSAGGGGASGLFRRPNYQRGSTGSKTRAVPDVSMLADISPGYAIFCSANDPDCVSQPHQNPWEALGGTSAATPLLAGGLAVVDQQLRAAHEQPLGLVNPLLYTIAGSSAAHSVFYDVTKFGNDVGSDLGNHRPLGCCSARAGYDEAAGIGSVDLSALASAAVLRQPRTVDINLSLPPHQHPFAAHELKATVACSGPCTIGAYADVTIVGAGPFEVKSGVTRLGRAGRRTLALRFSSRELGRLRSALSSRRRVTASFHGVLFDQAVYGVAADTGGSIAQRTGAKKLVIAS